MEKEKNIGITSEEMNNKRAGKRFFFSSNSQNSCNWKPHDFFFIHRLNRHFFIESKASSGRGMDSQIYKIKG